MTYVKITDKNGKPIDESNPLPVTGGGTGGSLEVDIVANSAGLATAQGQQDIVDAINNLSDASSEIYTDSVSIDDTGVQLPDLPIGEVIIQNDQDSGQDIYIGNDTDQELRLKPGEWISARITNLNLIYAKTTTGTATLRYFARSASGIPGGGSSPVPVQLTGRNVEVIQLLNAQAIADTIERSVSLPDAISKYKDIDFIITNTLDVNLGIGFRISSSSVNLPKADGSQRLAYLPPIPMTPDRCGHTVLAQSRSTPLSATPQAGPPFKTNAFKDFKTNVVGNYSIVYQALSTPSSGSVSIWLIGVIN